MQVPHEAIADAMRIRLELDANRHERHGPLGLLRELLLRTDANGSERVSERAVATARDSQVHVLRRREGLRDDEARGGYQTQIALV